MEEENFELENQEEQLLENRKLMKKSRFMIISFFTLFIVCVVLFAILQTNEFFIFNMNRSFENVPNPLVTELFSIFFIFIILFGFISYVIFTKEYRKRNLETENLQLETLPKFKKIYNIGDIFSVVPIFLVLVMVVNGFFYSFAQVDGISMEPTFCGNDIVVIQYETEYETQDIVIAGADNVYIIKRLVATAGDKLLVNSMGVYINDILIESNVYSDTKSYSEMIIPEGYYYILGDNRDHSQDSRYYGLFSKEDMYGQVVLKLSGTTCNPND